MVIYLDVLIAVNIFVTYIELVCTRVIVKRDTKKAGIIIATLLGGASSLIIFWEEMPLIFSVVYKLFVGIGISYIAFMPKNKKLFLKVTLAFFLVNFIFGGVMYFAEITFNMTSVIYMNGTVYFDISLLFLVSMTLICYGLLLLGDYILKRRTSENTLYDVKLYFRNETVELKALYDTGNHLTDGVESKPVIIAELYELLKLFTCEEVDYLRSSGITAEVPDSLKSILRIIPCNSVTGSSVLKAFIPSKIEIRNNEFCYETSFLVVAVLNDSLSNGEYNCILNSDIFERGKRIDVIKVNK
ncbi:MAG: sigma-E processing peptidase SpoIIGA [Clostridia bacterium]|nr:sigma-E processing peptidase SpoIIGA [Clostridia bacterium]